MTRKLTEFDVLAHVGAKLSQAKDQRIDGVGVAIYNYGRKGLTLYLDNGQAFLLRIEDDS